MQSILFSKSINVQINIRNKYHKVFDNSTYFVVFCDISKAFDRGWHRRLLFKLRRLGLSGSLLNLLFLVYINDIVDEIGTNIRLLMTLHFT